MDFEIIAFWLAWIGILFAWWWLWFKLFKKIGKDWTWAFLMFIPILNFIVGVWFIVYGWPNRPRPGNYDDYKQTGKML
ncbi:hypothetical protein ES703_11842 [subsurface metagenome]